ncbi:MULTISPECIES: hypothetical protein [unclassified Nostoc]|nr:hypothetical protein [Nostoc sp. S13]MDF5736982.1 hypothetical protein [Nostoc sp. S13]
MSYSLPMPHAQCPMPHAPCPMPNAPLPSQSQLKLAHLGLLEW